MNNPTTSGIPKSAQAQSLHPVQDLSIAGIAPQMLEWIISHCYVGMPISRNMVILKASMLDSDFCRK
jgi:hypothetical protein